MSEVHVDLRQHRCPRCAGDLVLRLDVDEAGRDVRLTVDTACASCGQSPWADSDERLLIFRPGSAGVPAGGTADELAAKLAAAYARVEQLVRRTEGLEGDLEAARRDLSRADERGRGRQSDAVAALRGDVSRLEGELAEARARMRKDEEATRGPVAPGLRPIEIE